MHIIFFVSKRDTSIDTSFGPSCVLARQYFYISKILSLAHFIHVGVFLTLCSPYLILFLYLDMHIFPCVYLLYYAFFIFLTFWILYFFLQTLSAGVYSVNTCMHFWDNYRSVV